MTHSFGIALGGLLGFGIGNIKGSLPSWKFEFLIIGALCCIWGVVMFIFLPDSPVTVCNTRLYDILSRPALTTSPDHVGKGAHTT